MEASCRSIICSNRPKIFVANIHLNRAHNEFVESWLETGIFGACSHGVVSSCGSGEDR